MLLLYASVHHTWNLKSYNPNVKIIYNLAVDIYHYSGKNSMQWELDHINKFYSQLWKISQSQTPS